MKQVQLAIIGGGPAGLSAAIAARKAGVEDILLIERDRELGGILNQCIHAGFGLHTFGPGAHRPGVAGEYVRQFRELNIPCLSGTMVLNLSPDRVLTVTGRGDGPRADSGAGRHSGHGLPGAPPWCAEHPGTRPAGIYSAGAAQRLVNVEGLMPGRDVVILGSGDIGLIMARRMTLEGARVHAVAEVMPYSGGLKRNIVQCLRTSISPVPPPPWWISTDGERLEAVTLAQGGRQPPHPGTERRIPATRCCCRWALPENELSREAGVQMDPVTGGVVSDDLSTSLPGVFACGNVLHVHDLVGLRVSGGGHAGKRRPLYPQRAGQTATVRLEGKRRPLYRSPAAGPHQADSVTVRFRVGNPIRRRRDGAVHSAAEELPESVRPTFQIGGGGSEMNIRELTCIGAPWAASCGPRWRMVSSLPSPAIPPRGDAARKECVHPSAPSPAPYGCWAARCRWCRYGRRGGTQGEGARWPRAAPRRRPCPVQAGQVVLPTCVAPAGLWVAHKKHRLLRLKVLCPVVT